MKNILSLFAIICIISLKGISQNIIPTPVSYEHTNGMFMFDNNVSLNIKTTDAKVLQYVKNFQTFINSGGSKIEIKAVSTIDQSHKVITVELVKQPILGSEGYNLEVKETEIILAANSADGIFNGLQTIRQLLPRDFESVGDYRMGMGMVMGCKITDYPRFGWRGLMLDVSRHFFSVEDVKAYIDKMSQFKYNVLHWHLTDDEGWRIEIKSLPKLTDVGAWRVERNGRFGEDRPFPKEGEKATNGGFYTQDQIREVVKYASERNVRIVPEIDVPGHSMALLAAYPELSTKKEPKFVNPGSKFADWHADGTFTMLIENTLNPADEKVYEVLDKIFTEVAALFPDEYIHMGGDECYHGFWDSDAKVKAFMKKNNLKDSHALQSYFVKRVEKIINSKGKKMIGWDEILEGGLEKTAAVMSWRGMKGGIEAAKMGHKVVMTPTTFAYLDYNQGDASVENKIYANLSLRKAYEFEPVPAGVDSTLILGGQGNLWTEVIPNLQYAYYMTYPRAFATIESLWASTKSKNWDLFVNKVENQFSRFDAAKTNISKAIYEPVVSVSKTDNKFMVDLKSEIQNSEIFYSIDNTYPVNYAKKYSGTFELPEGDFSLRTQTFRNGAAIGRELIIKREDLVKRVK